VNVIASRFAIRRSKLTYYLGLEHSDRKVLAVARTTLYMLKKKKLVHLVPRVLIINVPLLLLYYNANERSAEKTAVALTSQQIALPLWRAIELVNEVVSKYSTTFNAFIHQLLSFCRLYNKLVPVTIRGLAEEVPKKIVIHRSNGSIAEYDINRNEEAVKRFYNLLEHTFYHYLLYIIVDDEEKQKEFLNEIRRVFRLFNEHLVEELISRWRYLHNIVEQLAYDSDHRIRYTAKSFLEQVIFTTLSM